MVILISCYFFFTSSKIFKDFRFKSDFNLGKVKNVKIERIKAHIYATLIRIFLLLEVTKGIMVGHSEELSIRRIIKSSMEVLNSFLLNFKNEEAFERLSYK